MIVSQTWGEIGEINERIRIGLRSAGLIDKADATVMALARLDLTDAQKRDVRFYSDGAVIVFNRETKDFANGESGRLLKATPTHLLIQTENKIQRVPFKLLNRLTVYAINWLAGTSDLPHSRFQFDLGQPEFGFKIINRKRKDPFPAEKLSVMATKLMPR